MATVKKRTWTNKRGKTTTRFVVGYQDRDGTWRRTQRKTAAAANDERIRIEHDLSRGTHVADRASITVQQAVAAFLADYQLMVDAGKRERSTIEAYRQIARHIDAHDIAAIRISRLSGPDCATFSRWLENNRTAEQAARTWKLLRMVLDFAITSGWCGSNHADAMKPRDAGDRHETEVEIPAKADLLALINAAKKHGERAQAMVAVLLFCGLRASEMRGLRRADVDRSQCRVRQRADKYQKIGSPKSKKGRRDVPMPPDTWKALAAWMLKAPKSDAGLIFPTATGLPDSYANIWNRLWRPLMKDAGLVDDTGKPAFGLHALRHAAVSLWIEQGVNAKQVSKWAGHSSVAFTLDVYGHLWPDAGADTSVAAAMERSLYKA
jgi:integrase